MLTIRTPLDAGHVFSEDTLLMGSVRGSATVKSGRFETRGWVDGDLVIQPGATAILHGTVSGTVINLGGDVELHGIYGAARDSPGAKTKIAAEAVHAPHLLDWNTAWRTGICG